MLARSEASHHTIAIIPLRGTEQETTYATYFYYRFACATLGYYQSLVSLTGSADMLALDCREYRRCGRGEIQGRPA